MAVVLHHRQQHGADPGPIQVLVPPISGMAMVFTA